MEDLKITPVNDLNIHTTCRTCLGELEEYHTIIFEIPEFQKIFTDCTTLPVKLGDGLPTGICESCFSKINDIYEFQQKCRKAVKQFVVLDIPKLQNVNYITGENSWSVRADSQHLTIASNISNAIESLHVVTNEPNEKEEEAKHELESDQAIIDLIHEFDDESKATPQPVRVKAEKRVYQNTKIFPIKRSDRVPISNGNATQTQTNTVNKSRVVKVRRIKGIVCKDCGKILKNQSTFIRHCHMHNGPFLCTICEKRFIAKRSLEEHMNRHAGIRNYICSYCGVGKYSPEELRNHINVHTKERKFHCEICQKIFYNKTNFNRHKLVIHQGIKKYLCSFCDRRFSTSTERKNHERFHTGERPFECHICQKTYTLKTHLQTHLKEHDTPYECDICGQLFRTENLLNRHKRVFHEAKRHYSCPQCDKVFLSKQGRDLHIATHAEKQFECLVCLKKFLTLQQLEKHDARHTYKQCDMCPFSYNTTASLNKHKKEHHKVPQNENETATINLEQIIAEDQ